MQLSFRVPTIGNGDRNNLPLDLSDDSPFRGSMSLVNLKQTAKSLPSPIQDLDRLSFCPTKVAALELWASHLPLTHISRSAAILYKALPELSRLKISHEKRFSMLEALRPSVQQTITGLCNEFLAKPIALSERSVKAATLAQALQKHLSTGYEVCVKDLLDNCNKRISKEQGKNLTLYLHRAITSHCRQLLRYLQLYTPLPNGYWQDLHKLYLVAEHQNIHDCPVIDNIDTPKHPSTIRQAYCKALVLACSRTNQLRQQDINTIYEGMEFWSSLIEIGQLRSNDQSLFSVNLESDKGTVYSELTETHTGLWRHLDLTNLVSALKNYLKVGNQANLRMPTLINKDQINHLIRCWTLKLCREQTRKPSQGAISALAGITSIHYHLADKTTAEELACIANGYGGSSSQMVGSGKHLWDAAKDSSMDIGGFDVDLDELKQNSEKESARYQIHTGQMVDMSAKGLCIDWLRSPPDHLNTGEVIAVREAGRANWSIGTVRWLLRTKGKTRCGLELLSPRATPYLATVTKESGEEAGPFRVLMLPEMPSVGRPATILTTQSSTFQENQKIKLSFKGREIDVHITERVMGTCSFSLFAYQSFSTGNTENTSNDNLDDFSEVWGDL